MVLPTHPQKGEASARRAKNKKRRVHRMLLSILISMLVSSLVINMNIRREFKEKSQGHLTGKFSISTLLKLYFASNVHKTQLPLHLSLSLLGIVRSSLRAPQSLTCQASRACPVQCGCPSSHVATEHLMCSYSELRCTCTGGKKDSNMSH